MGKLEIMFVNDTHSEKLFYSIQCKNVAWFPLAFFVYLHNYLSSIHSIITY